MTEKSIFKAAFCILSIYLYPQPSIYHRSASRIEIKNVSNQPIDSLIVAIDEKQNNSIPDPLVAEKPRSLFKIDQNDINSHLPLQPNDSFTIPIAVHAYLPKSLHFFYFLPNFRNPTKPDYIFFYFSFSFPAEIMKER